MSIKRRLSKLEDRTPDIPIRWDGDPETAEVYVRAKAVTEKIGRDPGPFEGDDPKAYVTERLD